MRRHAIAMLTTAAALLANGFTPAAAQDIYVSQDAQGNPVYSDRPASGDAATIKLRDSNIYDPQPIPDVEPGSTRTEREDSDAVGYSLRITAPDNEAAIRAPEGRVQVEVSVEPSLKPEHTLQLLRNGDPVPGSGRSFAVQTYDRGANTFVARVMDGDRELARSAPVTVYLLRRSLLSPPPANPAPNFRPPGAP